jgi:hypothetical protein
MQARGGLLFAPGVDFRVTFHRGGRAELASVDSFGQPPTTSVSSISREEFGKLCYVAEVLHFDDLDNVTGTGADDIGDMMIEIASGGRTKAVREHGGGGPIQLWALARAIDDVKRHGRWVAR